MSAPTIKSGKFSAGRDLECGENVVIDVAEEVVVGDRCTLPDNAYLGGRRIEIGDDFYGYSWGHPAAAYVNSRTPRSEGNVSGDLLPVGRWLEIGRGRIDEEDAVLTVGSRCTFHDCRIDLSARVEIGNDVGLSPEICIYTHHYWMSPARGWPMRHAGVVVGDRVLVGFRSAILAGAVIPHDVVVGSQSVVAAKAMRPHAVYAGNPARTRHSLVPMPAEAKVMLVRDLVEQYNRSLEYRGFHDHKARASGPRVCLRGCRLDVDLGTAEGEEDEWTDDLREWFFRHGFRFYTQRRFRRMKR